MRRLLATALLILLPLHVTAQEQPYSGQLSSVSEWDTIVYDCETGTPLRCHFTQAKVTKPTLLTSEQAEASINGLVEAGQSPDFCGPILEAKRKLDAGEPVQTASTEAERADLATLLLPLLELCDHPSATTARLALEAGQAREAQTCNLFATSFDMAFNWNGQTDRWETISQPSGPCGSVTAAHMRKDGLFWVYGQQRIITNRGGSDPLLGSCADFPAEEMSYQWQARTVLAQCRYVEFSLF